MPVEINADPLDPLANCYVTLAEAADYLQGNLYYSEWTAITDDNTKERYLITATRMLDRSFKFVGVRTDPDRILEWPRSYVPDPSTIYYGYIANDTIPPKIKEATCELAIHLIHSGIDINAAQSELVLKGLKSIKVDVIEVVAADMSGATTALLPDYIAGMLRYLGTPLPGTGTQAGGYSTAIIDLKRG
jgi:hypothetical protein